MLFWNNKYSKQYLMLKYTAELSQEFRRASSLSTLEAYHRSKPSIQANYITTVENTNQKHNCGLNKFGLSQADKLRINACNKQYSSVQHKLQHSPAIHSSLNKFVRPTNPSCALQTKNATFSYLTQPKSRATIKTGESSLLKTNYTSNTKNQSTVYKNQCEAVLKPIQLNQVSSLNFINFDKINLPKKINYQPQSIKSNISIEQTINKNAMKKLQKTKQNKNSHAKMRISSINNLQNIQKRIQATLGQQRNLNI